MKRTAGVAFLALSGLAGTRAAAGQPYGCWAIRDTVERLACFDMALGPPVTDDGRREPSESAAPASNDADANPFAAGHSRLGPADERR